MGLIRRLLPLALLAVCALPAAADYIQVTDYSFKPYSEIRQDGEDANGAHAINETVALLSDSSLHGTLNRFSALLRRSQVSSLGTYPDARDELPANFKRAYSLALQDLNADIDSAWSELDATTQREERSVLLQLVSYVALERGLQWYDDKVSIGCAASEPIPAPFCVDLDEDDRQILDHLEVIPQTVAVTLLEIVDQANADCTGNCSTFLLSLAGMDPSRVDSRTLVNAMNELNYVHGEPIIDYLKRAIGVPSIDD